MTITVKSLVPQRLCQCHHEKKWKLLNPRWLTWQSLCPKAFLTMDTKHSLCLVWLWFALVYSQQWLCTSSHFNAVNPAERLVTYLCCGNALLKWLELLFTNVVPARIIRSFRENMSVLRYLMQFFKAVSTANQNNPSLLCRGRNLYAWTNKTAPMDDTVGADPLNANERWW